MKTSWKIRLQNSWILNFSLFYVADITIELRAMGVPWTLHCWMNALAAAHELRLDTVIDQLLQDFLQVCPDDYSQQFVMECLPLLFSIFRYSKVCVSNNFILSPPLSLSSATTRSCAPRVFFLLFVFYNFLWEDTQKHYVTLDLISHESTNKKLFKLLKAEAFLLSLVQTNYIFWKSTNE